MGDMYEVDFGSYWKTLTETDIRKLYADAIDQTDYPTFDGWMWDMERMGLVTKHA